MHLLPHDPRPLTELQRHWLPRRIPQPPGWQFVTYFASGRHPGADWHDVLPLPDGRVLFLIADAGEQSVASVALLAMLRVLLHSCPLSSGAEQLPFCPFREPLIQPPHILLDHLNRVLCENTLPSHHVTAFAGVLDPLDGNFHYASAGHPFPCWWRSHEGRAELINGAMGQPLANDSRACYHHRRIQIEPGDQLLLYSDGLTNALGLGGPLAECRGLNVAFSKAAVRGGADAVRHWLIMNSVGAMTKPPLDDMTFMVLERLA